MMAGVSGTHLPTGGYSATQGGWAWGYVDDNWFNNLNMNFGWVSATTTTSTYTVNVGANHQFVSAIHWLRHIDANSGQWQQSPQLQLTVSCPGGNGQSSLVGNTEVVVESTGNGGTCQEQVIWTGLQNGGSAPPAGWQENFAIEYTVR
jgi:hypothetical protein